MVSEAQSDMLRVLSPNLAALAVDLTVIAGSREYCFPLDAAPAVFEALVKNGVVILGGDLWECEEDGYFPVGETWYVDSSEGKSSSGHEARVRAAAGEFFARYGSMDDKWVTFVVKPVQAAS
ncbi:Imm40 family immunity protein [Symbioplanes lichenis]|uniref:Imm40 family immunity protein n=1 Tax=Symbioplanes lichenis TaxID=1629072 RepID=UPI002738CC83|nr:Imm40 family immunity protein [Actinoplanes lichenis]